MSAYVEARIAREDLPVEGGGPALIVRCRLPGCARAALFDPRRLFGSRRHWPAAGLSDRFRCACGGRQAALSYSFRTGWREGPIDRASLALWY
ncbi:MAG: hypothetical protein ACK4VY_09790 [Brevundimonas sp.]